MTPPINNRLFVYGTLLWRDTGTTGRSQRARLAREARVIAEATLPGRLYDLGRYPALVVDDDVPCRSAVSAVEPIVAPPGGQRQGPGPEAGPKPEQRVHGELLELADPTHSLAWLDAYEGIVPGRSPRNDYERIERTVTLTDGTTASAWVYVWRAALGPATLIPNGRWLSTNDVRS